MNSKADVVIIGAGCTGSSIALHLAKKGMRDIVLLDQSGIASGATGMSSAMIRVRYWNQIPASIAIKASKIFHDFANVVGGNCGFTETGLLWLFAERDMDNMVTNVEMLRKLGGEIHMISPREVAAIEPRISISDLAGAAWEPNAGYADPALTTLAYVERAKEFGVTVQQFNPVKSLKVCQGRVKAVITNQGEIETGIVVNATGIWGKKICRMVGIELPIYPTRIDIVHFRRPPSFGQEHPLAIDLVNGTWFRPFGTGVTQVGNDFQYPGEVDPDNLPPKPDWNVIEITSEKAVNRFQAFREASLQSSFSYAFDNTPDFHPILDETTFLGLSGFYCALGFSGHGFKEAPVVGEMMADLIIKGNKAGSYVDFFRLSRFAEGKPIYTPFNST